MEKWSCFHRLEESLTVGALLSGLGSEGSQGLPAAPVDRVALGLLQSSQQPFMPRVNQHPESDCQRAPLIGSLFASGVLFQLLSHRANITRGKPVSFHIYTEEKGSLALAVRDIKIRGVWGVFMFSSPKN